MKKAILTTLLLAFTFSVDAQSWWNNKRVKGNGNVTTESRKVGEFDGVSLGGFFDVILVKGREGKVTIEGEENLMEYIETDVKKGKLRIKVKRGINIKTTRRMTVTVPVEEIESVALGGSGNLKSEVLLKARNFDVSLGGSGNIQLEVKAEELKSSIAGSGNIELKGSANDIKCSIAGSGTIKAYEFYANNVKASIAGSGDVRISAKDYIKASIAGSGSVYYKGDPSVKKSVAGSGSVKSRN